MILKDYLFYDLIVVILIQFLHPNHQYPIYYQHIYSTFQKVQKNHYQLSDIIH